jgi:hypothetical protein
VTSELVSIDSIHALTLEQYSALADVPPEIEWLNNITNEKTRRFYKGDVAEFVAFTGLKDSAALRTVVRSHVIAWRKDMQNRSLGTATIRRKLSALSSLFDYLCERNAVLGNPVDGVKRHSRFAMLIKVPSKDTETVVAALSKHVLKLPATLRRSLTWDRGHEMAKHKSFTVDTNVKVYFCDQQSPWQRGTNENTNGLLSRIGFFVYPTFT